VGIVLRSSLPSNVILGESGDRKTTCDNQFKRGLRKWEKDINLENSDRVKRYEAQMEAWQIEVDGVKRGIKQSSKEGKVAKEAKEKLESLQVDRPKPPRVPTLLRSGSDTIEFLLHFLQNNWPSVGLMTNEGGTLFGGHAMNHETIVRTLALLDLLWDGQPLNAGTIARGDLCVSWARLTICVSVQPQIFIDFLTGNGRAARSIGFLSRFLSADPPSLQGKRLYRKPKGNIGLVKYEHRVLELLQLQTALADDGSLPVETLQLDDAAKAIWIEFHDDVEQALAPYGDFEPIKDIASKIADNAARIAAVIHTFVHDPTGKIGADSMTSACEVAGWHLGEAKRIYTSISASASESNARLLENWLVTKRAGEASKKDIIQKGPHRLRNKEARNQAIAMLVDLRRARDNESVVELHPSLRGQN